MNAYSRVRDEARRTGPEEGRAREGFRPLALPALAAAMHVEGAARRAASAKRTAGLPSAIVYEDEPLV